MLEAVDHLPELVLHGERVTQGPDVRPRGQLFCNAQNHEQEGLLHEAKILQHLAKLALGESYAWPFNGLAAKKKEMGNP